MVWILNVGLLKKLIKPNKNIDATKHTTMLTNFEQHTESTTQHITSDDNRFNPVYPLLGVCKNNYLQIKNMKKEQFAVYEKEPAHGKDKDGVILAPFNTKEEAEEARIKYGYDGDNYYVDKLK